MTLINMGPPIPSALLSLSLRNYLFTSLARGARQDSLGTLPASAHSATPPLRPLKCSKDLKTFANHLNHQILAPRQAFHAIFGQPFTQSFHGACDLLSDSGGPLE